MTILDPHNDVWAYLLLLLQEMGIPDHLTCLLRNLYAGQEATARTRHGTTDWFQTGKGAHQGCILSPCLFNLYVEYIMRNAGLDEAQAGIKMKIENEVSQSCSALCNPMDHSPTGSSVIGILQARILEWLPCPPPGDLPDPGIEPIPCVSCITGSFFTAETLGKSKTESCFIWPTF